MISIEVIKKLGVGSTLLEFAEFLIQEKGDRQFPDYHKLDLMKVPRLVPNVWVIDFRGGIADGMLFHFSGTAMDSQYGYNITGHTWEDCYTGEFGTSVLQYCYHPVFLEKKTGFTRRIDRFVSDHLDTHRTIEALLFPCSEDDDLINFGIGITAFSSANQEFEPIFTAL